MFVRGEPGPTKLLFPLFPSDTTRSFEKLNVQDPGSASLVSLFQYCITVLEGVRTLGKAPKASDGIESVATDKEAIFTKERLEYFDI